MKIVLITSLFAIFSSEAFSQSDVPDLPIFEENVTLADGYIEFSWEQFEDSVSFRIFTKNDGWTAIGFNPTNRMENADMVIFWFDEDGTGHYEDAYSTGPTGPHPSDTELGGTDNLQNVEFIQDVSGFDEISFTRLLDTGDEYDNVLGIDKEIKIIWAYGASNDVNRKHTSRGTATITIHHSTDTVVTESEDDDPRLHLNTHLVLMILGLLIAAAGLIVVRSRKIIKNWKTLHSLFKRIMFVLVLIGIGFAFAMVNASGGQHLRVPHAWVGIILLLMMLGNLVSGTIFTNRKGKTADLRTWHKRIGWTIIILFVLNLFLGLKTAHII